VASFFDIIVSYSRENVKEEKDEVIPVNSLKPYGVVEVRLHPFLTSAVGRVELPASWPR
jgi:hypothetical protein